MRGVFFPRPPPSGAAPTWLRPHGNTQTVPPVRTVPHPGNMGNSAPIRRASPYARIKNIWPMPSGRVAPISPGRGMEYTLCARFFLWPSFGSAAVGWASTGPSHGQFFLIKPVGPFSPQSCPIFGEPHFLCVAFFPHHAPQPSPEAHPNTQCLVAVLLKFPWAGFPPRTPAGSHSFFWRSVTPPPLSKKVLSAPPALPPQVCQVLGGVP